MPGGLVVIPLPTLAHAVVHQQQLFSCLFCSLQTPGFSNARKHILALFFVSGFWRHFIPLPLQFCIFLHQSAASPNRLSVQINHIWGFMMGFGALPHIWLDSIKAPEDLLKTPYLVKKGDLIYHNKSVFVHGHLSKSAGIKTTVCVNITAVAWKCHHYCVKDIKGLSAYPTDENDGSLSC